MLRLLSLAAFAALTVNATAADLPRRAPPAVFTPVPVFTWSGFFAGFSAGYGFDAGDEAATTTIGAGAASRLFLDAATSTPVDGLIAFGKSRTAEGFVGGGQIGYNYQVTPGSGVVIGVEADAHYADFGRRRSTFAGPVGTATDNAVVDPGLRIVDPNGASSLDVLGTVRGRVGYAFDRVLVYGTGGFAYAAGGEDRRDGRNGEKLRTGYAAGGGIEVALPTDSFLNFFRSSAVTFKVEGLYVNLDRKTESGVFAVDTATGAPVATTTDPNVTTTGGPKRRADEFAVVRAGVNYKFGSY